MHFQRNTAFALLLGSVLLIATPGCVIVVGADTGWNFGATFWTEKETETIALDVNNLTDLVVRTHNGAVTFNALPPGSTDAKVVVTKRAGGRSLSSSRDAREALEVYVDTSGGTRRIGYRWKGIKNPSWTAQVSFDISAPASVSLDAETHNGAAEVRGVSGDVKVLTHNGPVDVTSGGGRLQAESHNGQIKAQYAGGDVALTSHNGAVSADLTGAGPVNGRIVTHNGRIELGVGEQTSATLACETSNGSINWDVPVLTTKTSKREMEGKVGSGEGRLAVTTHNGSVRIKRAG